MRVENMNEPGRTRHDEAVRQMDQVIVDMQQAKALVDTSRPTKKARLQAFRLLSAVESRCASLKQAIDPW